MAKFGCPTRFIAMVRQSHDGMFARVQNDGELSDSFPVTNSVKQGFVLAASLFGMMFSAILTAAFQDGDNDIPIRYRFDGITKTRLYSFDPLKPHFYTVKLRFTGVYIFFLISAQKHKLRVLVRTASVRQF